MRELAIGRNDAGQRLDKFVSKATSGMPKSLLYKYIRTKRIKVNGKRAHEGDMLSEGDLISMYIPEEFFSGSGEEPDYSRVKIDPVIVYEDGNLLLCDKKPGVLVHLGDEGDGNLVMAAERETLIFALTAYLVRKGEYDPGSELSFAPALCNRIDRNTGGLVILAKNAATLRAVNQAIREDRVRKQYLCAVHGKLTGGKTLRGWHTKDPAKKTVSVSPVQVAGAKEIVTEYRAVAYNGELDLTLCIVTLITGRTHQIRAHFASIGHPLLGEGKYARNAGDRKLGFRSQALYSCALRFSFDDADYAYLNGRMFTVDGREIDFLRLFPNVSYSSLFEGNDD